ncbi:hypothetical protein OKW42_008415 [Paraburkholderia sp. WC7.3d]
MTSSDPGISPLRRRMLEDLRMRKFAPKTQAAYLRAVRQFARYLGRLPDTSGVYPIPPLSRTSGTTSCIWSITARRRCR